MASLLNSNIVIFSLYFTEPDLVVEEAYGEQEVWLGHPVGHAQVPQGVPQQQHVGPVLELWDVGSMQQRPLPLVEGMDQLASESLQYALIHQDKNNTISYKMHEWSGVLLLSRIFEN